MQNPMFPDILGMVFCGNLFIFAFNQNKASWNNFPERFLSF